MMTSRSLASVGALAATIAVASLVSLAGQAPSSTATATAEQESAAAKAAAMLNLAAVPKGWTPPKTAWGEPDLQGRWSYATLTPLERPLNWADKQSLTEKEIAAIEEARIADRDPEAGNVGTYNNVWRDVNHSDGRTSLIVDPPNGRRPPMTPEGQQRDAAKREYARLHPDDSWEDLPLRLRCISYHGVPPIPSDYGNVYHIFQTPGYVVMYDEELTGPRRIRLDSPHPSKDVALWNGDSRGRWEGNTLVVETTNFRADAATNAVMNQANLPTLRLVERFTRRGPDLMENRFTVYDPATYTAPWTAVLYMPTFTDGPIFEYACHEGNDSISAVLRGARVLEKAAAEAAKSGNTPVPPR